MLDERENETMGQRTEKNRGAWEASGVAEPQSHGDRPCGWVTSICQGLRVHLEPSLKMC